MILSANVLTPGLQIPMRLFALCVRDNETLGYFVFDCPDFREHFDSFWSNLCLKVQMKWFFLLLNLKVQQKSGRSLFTVS